MRKLQTIDVFAALRVISAAKISDEVKRVAVLIDEKENVNVQDVGIEFMVSCIEKLSGTGSEKAFYKMLSGPLEIPEKEIATMDPFELFDKICELKEVIDMDAAKRFFNSVAKLAEKQS